MGFNDLMYGPAGEVAAWLLYADRPQPRPTQEDLTAALINALNRIAYLEKTTADLDARARELGRNGVPGE